MIKYMSIESVTPSPSLRTYIKNHKSLCILTTMLQEPLLG